MRNFLRDVVMEDATAPDIERIVLSETSFRSQLDILKKVAHVRWPNSDWFKAVEEQVKALKGPLQDKRNRFIHDLWEKNDAGQMVRIERGKGETVVQRHRGEWQLRLTGEVAVPAAEVEGFFEEIANTYEKLLNLKSQFVEWRYEQKAAALTGGLFAEMADAVSGMPRARPLDRDGAK